MFRWTANRDGRKSSLRDLLDNQEEIRKLWVEDRARNEHGVSFQNDDRVKKTRIKGLIKVTSLQ